MGNTSMQPYNVYIRQKYICKYLKQNISTSLFYQDIFRVFELLLKLFDAIVLVLDFLFKLVDLFLNVCLFRRELKGGKRKSSLIYLSHGEGSVQLTSSLCTLFYKKGK
jgi:hypothetical protein